MEVIRNINPEICPPVEEMKTRLSKMFSNEVDGNMSLEENHRLVSDSIVQFTQLFNQYGIDYYIVSDVLSQKELIEVAQSISTIPVMK